MVALDIDAKRKGRKAMEGQLTASARIRRRFKAGPPRRTDLVVSIDRAVAEAWARLADVRGAM